MASECSTARTHARSAALRLNDAGGLGNTGATVGSSTAVWSIRVSRRWPQSCCHGAHCLENLCRDAAPFVDASPCQWCSGGDKLHDVVHMLLRRSRATSALAPSLDTGVYAGSSPGLRHSLCSVVHQPGACARAVAARGFRGAPGEAVVGLARGCVPTIYLGQGYVYDTP